MAELFDTKNVRSLELFYKPTCPYCAKVREFMKEHDIENVIEVDITTDAEGLARLVRIGGSSQVPCLFINGEPLYESNDIIAFLSRLLEDKEADRA